MKKDIKNKVAIITGSTRGIGKAIAHTLAKAGAKVVISSRNSEQVQATVKEFEAEGLECLGVVCNTGDIKALDTLVDETIAAFGTVDILVNNAGINPVISPITDVSLELYDKLMNVNLKAPFYLSQKVYPFMKKQGGGSIINVSSAEALRPGYGLGVYSISKSSLIMLSKTTAKEWGRDGIRVNCLCPGLIKTKFSSALWSDETTMAGIMKQQPLQRLGSTDDLAYLILLLVSPEGSYITGSVLTVDGGISI